jgi:hypothetical protein
LISVGSAIVLTELLGVLSEGHGGAVVVGVHDPGLRVLGPQRLQFLLEHGVVVLREVVVRLEAAGGVVVAGVPAGVKGQVSRRAADGQVPGHHQVRRAGLDQPLLIGSGVAARCDLQLFSAANRVEK